MNAAITLNNRGVQRLKQGNFKSALTVLKEAAELMYVATKALSDAEALPVVHTPEYLHEDTKNKETRNIFSAGVVKDDHVLKPSDNIFFIHDTPFTICSILPYDKQGLTIMSTIVLYNMSLTYHLSSSQCSAIPHAQECATTLYKMACSLAMKHSDDELMIRIAMASLNNLGCLHYELGDFTCAKEYLDDLACYLMTLGESYGGPVQLIQRNELMLNVIILRNPHAARAA